MSLEKAINHGGHGAHGGNPGANPDRLSHPSGEVKKSGKALSFCLSLCLCVSVVRNLG
jgi:hypothetical protein